MTENPATTRLREYLKIRTDHPKPDYKGAVAFLKQQAQRIGLPAKVYGKSNKPILVITWQGKNKTLPSIMLSSHMDVVPAYENKWSHKPFAAFKSDDGKIYGRGAQDMKSQGISYLEAVDKLKSEGFSPSRTIQVVYTPDQEIGGKEGMAEFLNTSQFKALNVGFAIDESCSAPQDAYLIFNDERVNWAMNITCQGTSGHGSMLLPNTPGEKARVVMDEFQDRREKEGAKLIGKPLETELGYVTTINLTMLEGGLQENCVPDSFKMTYDVRVSVQENHDELDNWIQNVMKKAGAGSSVSFIRKEKKVEPTKVDDSNPFWLALKAAVEKLGHRVMPVPNPGSSDARHLRSIGVPVLGFTAIRNTPLLTHAHDEYIPEKIFLEGIEVYKKKLEPGEDEDFAGNYFKPKRAAELLIKAQQDVARANNYMCGNKVNLQGSLNAINTLSSLKASPPSFLNHSWSGPQTTMNGWMGKADPAVKKPARLEALPVLDRKPIHKQLNTLDVI